MKVIALAVVCIILAAGLVGVTAIYLANGNSADLKAQIRRKITQLASVAKSIIHCTSNPACPNPQTHQFTRTKLHSLNAQLADLNDTYKHLLQHCIDEVIRVLNFQQTSCNPRCQRKHTSIFGDEILLRGIRYYSSNASANTTYAEVSTPIRSTNFDY